MNPDNITTIKKKYRIPDSLLTEDEVKCRIHLIPDKIDALLYFYPNGFPPGYATKYPKGNLPLFW